MVRFFGAALTIGAFSAIGISMSHKLKNRADTIAQIISAMRFAKSEIAFRLAPIGEIMSSLEKKSGLLARPFFRSVAENMSLSENSNFDEIWNKSLDKLIWINSEDKAAVAEAALVLGKCDAEGQAEGLGYIMRRLEGRLHRAEEEHAAKSKVYRALGAGIGVIAVLLVI